MIDVQHLTRAYGDFLAVSDVSFHIAKGEIVGLLGHNGAGKTTIMKMLSGYLEPSGGQIRIDGIPLNENPAAVQRHLGYLPENLPVYPDMTVADYLDYSAHLKGLQGEACRSAIRRAVQATDIGDKLLSPIATLSRGYKQRVGVAQALLGQPKLLILDEPTNGLDPTQTQQMRALIRTLAREATVILSTHIMQEVDALCDRVLMLRAGQLEVDAKLADLRRSGCLLLATDMPQAKAQQCLASIDGIARIEPLAATAGQQRYRLQLKSGAEAASISAAVAKAVVGAGQALYQLHCEHRDLETVFREVNEGGALHHAA